MYDSCGKEMTRVVELEGYCVDSQGVRNNSKTLELNTDVNNNYTTFLITMGQYTVLFDFQIRNNSGGYICLPHHWSVSLQHEDYAIISLHFLKTKSFISNYLLSTFHCVIFLLLRNSVSSKITKVILIRYHNFIKILQFLQNSAKVSHLNEIET